MEKFGFEHATTQGKKERVRHRNHLTTSHLVINIVITLYV